MLTASAPVAWIDDGRQVDGLTFRDGDARDIASINTVIAAAMATWNLAERVKRISLPLYQYRAQDLDYLRVVVAENGRKGIVGVATIDTAGFLDYPAAVGASLLHGIYVDPRQYRSGIGSRLLQKMERLASASGCLSMLAKAKPDAVAFFEAQGYTLLPIEDDSRDYPLRYCKRL